MSQLIEQRGSKVSISRLVTGRRIDAAKDAASVLGQIVVFLIGSVLSQYAKPILDFSSIVGLSFWIFEPQ